MFVSRFTFLGVCLLLLLLLPAVIESCQHGRRKLKAKPNVCKYRVTTITSNEAGADTDDNMYVTLSLGGAGKGGEKTTELIKLDNKGRDDFKRHQTDIFHIRATCFNDPAVITMWSKGTEEPPQRVCLEGDAWKVFVVTVELIKNGKPAWTMSCFFDEWLKCSHKRCEHMWLE